MSALYQRARPFTFDQVVGQEHVKEVLASAVARGMTGHAYLFSGPRGVGKTTTARLMAMAVNCEREPAQRPCGRCESCRLVRDGAHPDVLELDAASNNSVEDVRSLRERAGLASLRGGTRVWILDEAHMLSRAAANALLKTLEEPPPGLMFVLATTEPEKLPPTILSRCQHFRFRRLTDAEILGKLTRLCQEASVEAEPAALELVARAAEGAMRDAESLLERLLVGGGPITAAAAEDALGLPPRERLLELADALLAGDLARLLPRAGDLYRAGFAPRTVAEQLGRTLRDRLHEALSGGSADESRLVALIHALDDELERFTRRDDLYGLEVALIKAVNAGRPGAAARPDPAELAPQSPPRAAEATAASPGAGAPRAAEAQASSPGAGAPRARRPAADPPAPPAAAPGGSGDPGTATAPSPREHAPSADPPGEGDESPSSAPLPGDPEPDAAGGRRSFSWHAVRSAATPQLKAFLQPARVEEAGGRVTVEFGEGWRFHYEQVLARAAELEELIARVAGPGYTLELKGPRGGQGPRRRPAPEPARAAAPARPAAAARAAARPPSTAAAAAQPSPATAEPPREASAEDPEPPPDEDEPYEALPPGFWDDEPAYGGHGPPPEAYGPPPGGEGDPPPPAASRPAGAAGARPAASAPPQVGVALEQLQRLFPGRVIEFRPHAAAEEEAAPDADGAGAQGYDDEAQDRLELDGGAPDEV